MPIKTMRQLSDFLFKPRTAPAARVGIFILMISPILFFAIMNSFSIYQADTKSVYEKKKAAAYLAATVVRERLVKAVELAQAISKRQTLDQFVMTDQWLEAAKSLSDVPGFVPLIDAVFITDKDGILRGGTTPEFNDITGKSFAFRDWYKGVSQNWTPYVSEVYKRANKPQYNIFAIAIPIKKAAIPTTSTAQVTTADDIAGILVFQVRITLFADWARDVFRRDKNFLYIVDHHGNLVYHPNFSEEGGILRFKENLPLGSYREKGESVFIINGDPGGEDSVISYQEVQDFGWGVVVGESKRLVFAERDRTLFSAILIYGLLIFLAVLFDAQVRKRRQEAEKILKESEERLRQITEALPIAVFRYSLDNKGNQRFLFISNFAETIFGASPEILMKDFNRAWSLALPDEIERLAQSIKVSAGLLTPWIHEFKIKDPSGKIKWLHVESSPEGKESSGTVIYNGYFMDITVRKEAELEIIEAKERFRQIAENIKEVFWLSSADSSQMLYVSPAYEIIWGRSCESLYNNPLSWSDALHPDDRERIKKNSQLHSIDQEFTMEYRIIHPDKSVRWIQVRTTPIRDAEGNIHRIAGTAADITEERKVEAQFLQSQKIESVGTLAGGIAHDLNNQLTPVKGYIHLLLQQTDPEHPSYRMLSEVDQATQRCVDMVERLMQFSRPTMEKIAYIRISTVLDEFKTIITKVLPSNIRIEFNYKNDLWPVEADETQIESVLMNLCVNARDAMPEGGDLTIMAKNVVLDNEIAGEGGAKNRLFLYLSVKDSGVGMPPEILSRIFEPFFTTKEKTSGTGLGLPMVYRTIHLYGGWIEVSSHEGQGSIFQVYLPASPGSKVIDDKKKKIVFEHLMSKNETILFADDEEMIRRLGKAFLERLGYHVLLACDGEETLSVYQANLKSIDAVVLDMTMPKMTGMQMIQNILKINPEAKIIATSGYTAEGTQQSIRDQGALGFIQKPYTIEVIGELLRKVLGGP